MMKKITDSQYFIRLYFYYFTFQALLKSVLPILLNTELGLFRRLHILALETKFFFESSIYKIILDTCNA